MAFAMEARESFRSLWPPMLFMEQGIWIHHTVSSSSVNQLRSARTSLSRFPAAVGQSNVPNDDSGLLSVIPIALFGSEAVNSFVPPRRTLWWVSSWWLSCLSSLRHEQR